MWRYWKVVLRYGHVGHRREVSVARYLQVESELNLLQVMELSNDMPGVKHRGVNMIREIDEETYILGKSMEEENIFLQKLRCINRFSNCVASERAIY